MHWSKVSHFGACALGLRLLSGRAGARCRRRRQPERLFDRPILAVSPPSGPIPSSRMTAAPTSATMLNELVLGSVFSKKGNDLLMAKMSRAAKSCLSIGGPPVDIGTMFQQEPHDLDRVCH